MSDQDLKVWLKAENGVIPVPHVGISLRVLMSVATEARQLNGQNHWPVVLDDGHQIATIHLR
jgi:hypothetical protein